MYNTLVFVFWSFTLVVCIVLSNCPFNMCYEVPNYTEEKIKTVIENNRDLQSYYFGKIVEPPVSIANRDEQNDFKYFCEARPKTDIFETLEVKYDIQGKKKIIANVGDYRQAVRYHTCIGSDPFSKGLANGNPKCVQMFQVIKLLTVNEKNDSLEYSSFKFPMTCAAAYE